MKISIRLLDLIKDSSIMATIWERELSSTTDWETLSHLFYSYRSVVEEMFDIDCEPEYSELYRRVLDRFERSW